MRSACRTHVPVLALLALLACCGGGATGPERLAVSDWRMAGNRPRPRSDLLGDVWGEDNGVERKSWLNGMHRTAPGDDWRALERANARAERARRRSLAPDAPRAGTWEEVGSSNQAGHTRCAALGSARSDGSRRVYVGSANGGLWRGDLEGKDWTPLSDALFGGVDGVLALPPAGAGTADVVLMRRGSEVFRSVDDGATWTGPRGLEGVTRLHRMRRGPSVVWILAVAEDGRTTLLASSDGAATFAPRWSGDAADDADLWVARTGPREGRELWLALDGELWRSLDGGASFAEGPSVGTPVDGVALAGSEAGGPLLYLAARVRGEWRLHRARPGNELERVADLEDFWGPLIAFAGDADVVMYGGLEAHRSADGGRSFSRVNAWGQYYGDPIGKLHADVRGLSSVPDPRRRGEDLCFLSTDGGTYVSTDRGRTVRNLCATGLGVAQVYSTLSAADDPDLILAGTQDQGYQRARRREPVPRGPSTPFDQLLSGDYGYLTSSDGGHGLVYSSYPGFVLVQEGARAPELLYPWIDLPAAAEHAWMPPIVADPTDAERFYLLADRLYRYRRTEGPYWAYRAHAERDFTAGGGRFLTALAFAPGRLRLALAANDVGRLWWSPDGAETWNAARTTGAEYLRPTVIAAHPLDAGRAAVGGAGYSGPAVLLTRDGGRTWIPAPPGLPRTLVLDLAWAGEGGDDLYAATEAGAWRLRKEAERWENVMGREAPATTYWSVEAVPDGRLRFGTYGRGIWDFVPGGPGAR